MAPGGLSAGPTETPGFARLEARRRAPLFRQPLNDRTIGPVVTVAMIGQCLERPHHGFDLGHFFLEARDMFERESLDVGAGAASVGPEAQQLADLLHGDRKSTRLNSSH